MAKGFTSKIGGFSKSSKSVSKLKSNYKNKEANDAESKRREEQEYAEIRGTSHFLTRESWCD